MIKKLLFKSIAFYYSILCIFDIHEGNVITYDNRQWVVYKDMNNKYFNIATLTNNYKEFKINIHKSKLKKVCSLENYYNSFKWYYKWFVKNYYDAYRYNGLNGYLTLRKGKK